MVDGGSFGILDEFVQVNCGRTVSTQGKGVDTEIEVHLTEVGTRELRTNEARCPMSWRLRFLRGNEDCRPHDAPNATETCWARPLVLVQVLEEILRMNKGSSDGINWAIEKKSISIGRDETRLTH